MNCIKCGREIPEGELFCAACSLAPAHKEAAHPPAARQQRKPTKRAAPLPPSKRPVQKRPAEPEKKRSLRAAVAIVLLSLMLALSLTYIGLSYNRLAQDRGRLRTREADLQVRENEIAGLEREWETMSQQLAAAQESEKKLRAEVERLSRQLNDSQRQLLTGMLAELRLAHTMEQMRLFRATLALSRELSGLVQP